MTLRSEFHFPHVANDRGSGLGAGPRAPPKSRLTAAAPGGRQDFLIPKAGNQLLRSRAGFVSIYVCVGGSALRE